MIATSTQRPMTMYRAREGRSWAGMASDYMPAPGTPVISE